MTENKFKADSPQAPIPEAEYTEYGESMGVREDRENSEDTGYSEDNKVSPENEESLANEGNTAKAKGKLFGGIFKEPVPVNGGGAAKPPLSKPKNAYWVWGVLAIILLASIIYALNFVTSAVLLMLFYIYWLRRGYTGKNNLGIWAYTFLGISYLMRVKETGLGAENSMGFFLFGLAFCACTALLVYAKMRYIKWARAQELIKEKQGYGGEYSYPEDDLTEGDEAESGEDSPLEAMGQGDNLQEYEEDEEEYAEEDEENPEYLNYEHPYDGNTSIFSADLSHPYGENPHTPKDIEGKKRIIIPRKGRESLDEGKENTFPEEESPEN